MEIQETPLIQLKSYSKNPRKGNIDLIAESLKTYGQYKPITVNKRTGEILAGNHTYQAAMRLGWATIATTFVDVDEETAAKIVLMDNRTSDSGAYDDNKLLSLLDSFSDLEATGYTNKDHKELLQMLDKPDNGLRNTVMGKNLKEWGETLNDRKTRIIMFDMEKITYNWVIEKLVQYRDDNNLENNSSAVVRLMEEVLGESAPEATE